MTSRGKDPLDDEFDAFLAGEGELARQLSALRQPESPPLLTEAIMATAEAQMAQERARRGAAANDGGPDVAPVSRPSFTTRWRVPVAMAASVIGAVLLMLEWQRGDYMPPDRTEMRAQAEIAAATEATPAIASASESISASTSVPVPAPAPASAPAPARAKRAAPAMAQAADKAPPPIQEPEIQAVAPVARERAESLAYAPAPAPAAPLQERMAVAARAAPAPAPMSALPTPAMARAPAPPPPPAPIAVAGSAARAAVAPASEPKAAAWLNVIDEMLKADLRKDAQDEWKKFRLAYPDYPVPEALAKRIAALD